MKELSLDHVGRRLKGVRTQLQLTREAFAEEVGISPQFLAELENGKKGMSAETLFKLCNRFDLSADYLLFGRSASDQIYDPINNALSRFPEPYLEMTENIIRAIEKAVVTN